MGKTKRARESKKNGNNARQVETKPRKASSAMGIHPWLLFDWLEHEFFHAILDGGHLDVNGDWFQPVFLGWNEPSI